MRIYTSVKEAVREVERDLWEMGIKVQPQTMQNKNVADDPAYKTVEVRWYGFQISGFEWSRMVETEVVEYLAGPNAEHMLRYIEREFEDRIGGVPKNPGTSYVERAKLWAEFQREDGTFDYTYSERIAPQYDAILNELKVHPETRQAIINIHSNIAPLRNMSSAFVSQDPVQPSDDLNGIGGVKRIPCSLYYQFLRREGKLDMAYVMRSCDFLTHFPVDLSLAIRLQHKFAGYLGVPMGMFTYFTGSLHAYHKDMKERGIF